MAKGRNKRKVQKKEIVGERFEIPIRWIVKAEQFQVRNKVNMSTVAKYRGIIKSHDNVSPFPPILLAQKEDRYYLVDGWHRVAAMEWVNLETVDAIIVKVTTDDEIRWLSAQANLTHGLALKTSEIREAFRIYIRAKQYKREDKSYKSYREISQDLAGNVGHTTVRNWMLKDFPKLAAMYSQTEPRNHYSESTGKYKRKDMNTIVNQFRSALTQINATISDTRSIEGKKKLLKVLDVMREQVRNDIAGIERTKSGYEFELDECPF
jgi:hypothetical protein